MTRWLWMLWPPVILLMGTFGNVATIGTLSRMGSGRGAGGWSTMNMYLLALAGSDLVILYAGLLHYWLLEVFSLDIFSWHTALCKLGMWLFSTSWNSSNYLLVALTLQRTLSVLWPHRVHLLCTRTTTKAVIGGISLTSFLLHSHVAYGYDVEMIGVNGSFTLCKQSTGVYTDFITEIWMTVGIILFTVFPFLCLILSNGILAWKLALSVQEAKQSLSMAGPSKQVKTRKRKVNSTTTTVLVMSFIFIILYLPYFVLSITVTYTNNDVTEVIEEELTDMDYFVQGFVLILLLCNSAVNFYLYCLTGTRFRNEMKKWVFDLCLQFTSRSPVTRSVVNSGAIQDSGEEF